MPMPLLNQIIDCSVLSVNEINNSIKELISHNIKNVILKNANGKENLLEGLTGNIKIEVFGNTAPYFANKINGPKIIVNGDVGANSLCDVKQGKITVFGSCGNNFGGNVTSCEFYVLDNCGFDSFSNLTDLSCAVIGGQVGKNFAGKTNGGKIIILNLKGGTMFLDDNSSWFHNFNDGFIYLRGEYKLNTDKFLLEKVNEKDEDVYLPLVSEFARLFKYSLSDIKSKPIYKVILK